VLGADLDVFPDAGGVGVGAVAGGASDGAGGAGVAGVRASGVPGVVRIGADSRCTALTVPTEPRASTEPASTSRVGIEGIAVAPFAVIGSVVWTIAGGADRVIVITLSS
jgi:hypothetical protein